MDSFIESCRKLRGEIKEIGSATKSLAEQSSHLEDAAMRLGKAIQAYDGGTSAYDK